MTELTAYDMLNTALDEIELGKDRCVERINASTPNDSVYYILNVLAKSLKYSLDQIDKGNVK